MQISCIDIIEIMEDIAPPHLAENWDNIGLIIGDETQPVNKILIALDTTSEVIDEAINLGVDLIINHHPIIFKPINRINNQTFLGKSILKIIKNNINIYCSHTNLDVVNGGTSDELAKILELNDLQILDLDYGLNGLGRVCDLDKPVTLGQLSQKTKDKIGLNGITFVGNKTDSVNKIGICTGSCGTPEYFDAFKKAGCDTYITSDIKYHDAQYAINIGLNLIDATHFGSEVPIVNSLAKRLVAEITKKGFEVEVITSQIDGQVFKML